MRVCFDKFLFAGCCFPRYCSVSLRTRSGGDKGAMALDEFVEKIVAEVESKSLELTM